MSTNDPTFEIPPRNTRAFAEYKAGVEWEHAHGVPLETRWSPETRPGQNHEWGARGITGPITDWHAADYRVAPAPPAPPELHPIDQWRAMSPEEREGKVLELHIGGPTWSSCSDRWLALDGDSVERYKSITDYTFRIRELTLAERNAAVREKWEAMEETDRPGRRHDKEGKLWGWTLDGLPRIVNPEWSWVSVSEYRLVELPEPPQPRYVPWTAETCPVGSVVRNKRGERSVILCAVSDSSGWKAYATALGHKPFDVCLEEWTMDDGTPAGTLEQPQP